jgi:hypothetical protein
MGDQRHRPTVTFLREDDAASFAFRGGGNNGSKIAVQIRTTAPEQPCRVCQANFHALL